MARGRKRKAGRRHPCGKLVRASVGETQRDAVATVLQARQRHYGVTAKQAKDKRLGTALGRLAFSGKIAADQYAAGDMYGEIMARNRAVMGLPMDQPRSVTGLLINEGIFGGSTPDHDPALVEKVRRRAAAAMMMLRTADADAPGAVDRKPSTLVHAVVCHEVEAATWSAADIINLGHGLDALVRLFGDRRDSS
ncbi:hypothetical protein FHS51_001073 [Sphingobium wenxiniae]|uniref:Uncharacterized protein n=1 Tax=Sphingobium wenxiniae (strain DSM 21828 / CGMCC 1.7748 / JZ-1) TaxID=595605 RepID=A0A562KEI6_SPHWJ|nr:hypothetical protein [Sphingobium wenxiniae]MBB6190853.1 hypothetical protein [Sphingobium wenxiniae]TWH93838.1 hypothetical protein IQ35_02048 [Sphingobium wenxiniae]